MKPIASNRPPSPVRQPENGAASLPKGRQPASISCERHFRNWKRTLAQRTDQWLLLWLPRNLVWFNPAAVRRRGLTSPTMSLQAALARLGTVDSHCAMDAVEKSLRKPGVHSVRLKLHMDQLRTEATAGHRLVRCRGCRNKCGLVVIRIAA
jgi:hypothetical protein